MITSCQAGILRKLVALARAENKSDRVEVAQDQSGVYVVVSEVAGIDTAAVIFLSHSRKGMVLVLLSCTRLKGLRD